MTKKKLIEYLEKELADTRKILEGRKNDLMADDALEPDQEVEDAIDDWELQTEAENAIWEHGYITGLLRALNRLESKKHD